MSSAYEGNSGNITPPLGATDVASTMPDDGDDLDAASVRVALEFIYDVCDYLAQWTNIADDGVDHFRYPPMRPLLDGAWVVNVSGNVPVSQQVTSGGVMWFELDLPHDARVVYVGVVVEGASGHAAFPGGAPTFPSVGFFKYDPATATATQIGSTTTDASASVAIYEAPHNLEVTQAHTVDRLTYRYLLKVTGEAGGNYIAGLRVHAPLVDFHTTKIDSLGRG